MGEAAVAAALSAIPPGSTTPNGPVGASQQVIFSNKKGSQVKCRLYRLPAMRRLDSDFGVAVWIFSPPATGEGRGNGDAWLGESLRWLFKAVYWVPVPTFNPPPPDAEGVIACFSISSCFFLFLSTASGFLTPLYVVWREGGRGT